MLNDDSLKKIFFLQTIFKKRYLLLISMEPLHIVMYDGMITTMEILKVLHTF